MDVLNAAHKAMFRRFAEDVVNRGALDGIQDVFAPGLTEPPTLSLDDRVAAGKGDVEPMHS